MSRITMFVAICILVTTTAIDGNATQPSVSDAMQKSGGSGFNFSRVYFYPAYPNTCTSYASRTDQIEFSMREVDANGHDVNWVMAPQQGYFVNGQPGPYYDSVSGYWYSYCAALATYHGTTNGGTFHIWTDLGTDGFSYYWVIDEYIYSTQ
jgi:hypothetical protein